MTVTSEMLNFEMPDATQEFYQEFKTWANRTIHGYESASFALIEDSEIGKGWNINLKLWTDDQGFTVDTMCREDLKNDLEERFREKSPEVSLVNVKLIKIFLPIKIAICWSIDLKN